MKLSLNNSSNELFHGSKIEIENTKELINIKLALAEYRNTFERMGDNEKVSELDKMLDSLEIRY
ncbi:hypothetical protein GOM49_17540 [Clostridium bovifaecis]|uniref:Uncharacterized protein n=1 Tax=Clostridium bovifaecis TaxID=2184719 RepID=A0A6I6F611_9CLOT|nr:hypothetical protein GOM49_17540 [Clostridium bovifaecis]